MGIFETVVNARKEGFNAQRGVFLDPLARCFLLKRAGQSGKFSFIAEMARDWSVKFNEYRGQMRFRFAVAEASFADTIAQTTHIAYGVPIANVLEVYAIDPERRDIDAPTVSSPLWKVYGTKAPLERFTIPVIVPFAPEDIGGVF